MTRFAVRLGASEIEVISANPTARGIGADGISVVFPKPEETVKKKKEIRGWITCLKGFLF